jgi:hypothetical protein
LVISPPDLIASKVISYHRRRGSPKAFTDRRDIAMLLLEFPELKSRSGRVANGIRAAAVEPEVLTTWHELVAEEIKQPDPDDEFEGEI